MFLLFDNSSLRTSTTILPFFLQQVPYFQETAPQLHADVRSLKPKYTNFSTDQLPSLTHRKSTIRPIPWLHAPVLNSTNDTLNRPRSCPFPDPLLDPRPLSDPLFAPRSDPRYDSLFNPRLDPRP